MLKRMVLSPPELRRYSRHLKLAEIGVAGQVADQAADGLGVDIDGLASCSTIRATWASRKLKPRARALQLSIRRLRCLPTRASCAPLMCANSSASTI